MQQGEAPTARSLFEESLALFRALGQRHFIATLLSSLGKAVARQEDLQTALACFRESLTLFEQMDDQRSMAVCLEGWARVLARRGDATWAAQVWGMVQMLSDAGGSSDLSSLFTLPGEDADDEQLRSRMQVQLGEKGFAQAQAAGRAMTPVQALSAQGHTLPSEQPATSTTADRSQVFPSTATDDLTRREVEVLRLVAQGLTDTQIAELLVISPRTVNAHLRSIYSKLAITSRHAAMRYALEHHLV
jgi:DNA-binding CsgD family transcriptional regulator